MAGVPGGVKDLVAWRPPRARTEVEAVDRGLVALALVWQLLWALADRRVWPLEFSGGWLSAVMLVSLGMWSLLLVSHLTGRLVASPVARVLDVAGLVMASFALTIAVAGTPEHDWSIAASWAVLPAAMAGLLLNWRGAIVVVVVVSGTVGFAALEVLGSASASGNQAAAHDVLYAAYSLSVGVVAMAARHVLLRDAAAADAAELAAATANADRRAAQLVEASAQREQRLLHETVLNTLTAIVRGGTGAPTLRQALTRRCQESARVLRAFQSAPPMDRPSARQDVTADLAGDLASAIGELRAAGIDVHVDCQPLTAPSAVYGAVLTASREALTNARRHSAAKHVWLRARQLGVGVHVDVRDDGCGFVGVDEAAATGRFGLTNGIMAPLAEVGGSARISTSPGDGTAIVLSWRPEAGGRPASGPTTSASFVIPALVAFGSYSAAVFALGLESTMHPALDVVAFAVFAALAILVGWSSRRGSLPWWTVLTAAGVAPLVYQLQFLAGMDSGHDNWQEWASGAISSIFVVLIAAGPRLAWLVVVPAWLVIQGDIVGELLAAGTAVLLAAALFARSTRRSARALAEAREKAVAQVAAERAATEQVRRMKERYRALEESTAVDLLEGIADGTRDPDSPPVRTWADLEDRFIRTVLRIDPAVDDLRALVSDLAVQARRSGLLLDVSVPGDLPVMSVGLAAVRSTLLAAVAAGVPGQQARLTVQTVDGEQTLRLVVPVRDDARADLSHRQPSGLDLGPGDPDMLWEVALDVVEPVPEGTPTVTTVARE